MKDSADGTIVIGSDTVVVFENVILGKPHDTEDAVNTLKKLQANTHQVYTGVSVWERRKSGQNILFMKYRCDVLSGFR